jgi:hypothetical protein
MFRKEPAPDLIRGGNRFSEKNMRTLEETDPIRPRPA